MRCLCRNVLLFVQRVQCLGDLCSPYSVLALVEWLHALCDACTMVPGFGLAVMFFTSGSSIVAVHVTELTVNATTSSA